MPRTLSKSDFKLARTCVTKLHYREHGYPDALADDPYLAMLAEGGYMVEQLARLMFPDGEELTYGADASANWADTRARLDADHVTLFEATLLSGVKQARVDILVKRREHFDLIEVKSKSMDGEDFDAGPMGPFRGKRKPHKLLTPWLPYLEDVAYQTMVLRELFPHATITPHLLVVDKAKTTSTDGLPALFEVRRGVVVDGRPKDLDVRFVGDADAIVPGEFLTVQDVSSEVDELMPLVLAESARFAALYDGDAVERVARAIDWSCRDCEFRIRGDATPNGFRDCWGALADPSPHLFDLYRLGLNKVGSERLGDLLIREGRCSMYDVEVARLVKSDGTPTKDSTRQAIQLEYTRRDEPWIGERMAPSLAALEWPLHCIDFETSLLAVPYHAGMRPYEKVAFQWSCHTLRGAETEPEHADWLNASDAWPNAEFVRTLRARIGDTGRVLTWSSYERTVLREVRDQLARYDADESELVAWIDALVGDDDHEGRLFDLHALCRDAYFHPAMKGSTSIKVVLDALWKSDPVLRERYASWTGRAADAAVGPYEGLPPITVGGIDLNVTEGTGAMRAYQAMMFGAERHEPAARDTLRELLRRYCTLDTLAMVLIWDHWRRVAR